jgi:hypothetical protein
MMAGKEGSTGRVIAFVAVFVALNLGTGNLREVQAQIDPPDLWDPVVLPNLAPILSNGAAAWGDYDGDGDLDIFATGFRRAVNNTGPYAQLYLNQGDYALPDPGGGESEEMATDYTPAFANADPRIFEEFFSWRGSVAWGDFDGDGLLDLASTGIGSAGSRYLWIYRNTGASGSPEYFELTFRIGGGLTEGDMDWGDYDNDGDLDLLISGRDSAGAARTKLFENRVRIGGGFVEQEVGLDDFWHSRSAWGDYDNDLDLDLLMTGVTGSGEYITRLYINQGAGGFQNANAGLPGLLHGTVAWGDGDADGDLDILMTGGTIGPFLLKGGVHVFENDGGSFSESGSSIQGLYGAEGSGRYGGDAEWGDFNNDGLLDFFVTGYESPLSIESGRTYESRGGLQFVYSTIGFRNGLFSSGTNGSAFWGDYDNDGDLDIFSTGIPPGGGLLALTFNNYLPFYPRNSRPFAPGSLLSAVDGSQVSFTWAPGQDGSAPAQALTYNLRVGTTPGAGNIMSPMATASGSRLLSAMGNAGHNLGWKLTNLAPGTYYWTVQTVDTSYSGSAFAPEDTFTIQ